MVNHTEPTPLISPDEFKPPTLLFPPDRVAIARIKPQTPWIELGPGIQDKYRVRAHWLIQHSHVLKQDVEELAQAIYEDNPAMIAL